MEPDPLLGRSFKEQYTGYYRGQEGLAEKRTLAASDSFGHMRDLLGSDGFKNLIDVGAGEGSFLAAVHASLPSVALYAVEISESGLEAIQSRGLDRLVEARLFDGYHIPYPDKTFDLATAVHVLEHVEHERLFLAELKRVARRLVLEVPLENGFRVERAIAASSPFGHINYYTPEVFLNLLRTSGLKVLRAKVTASSTRYEQHVSGRTMGLVKNLVRKAALRVAPRVAVWSFNYLLTVYCTDA